MNALQRHNAHAMSAGQAAWDNASPSEDDGREDYINAQVERLLGADDADLVPFISTHTRAGFVEAASEAIADADDQDGYLVQLVLAVRRADFTLATSLANHFDAALCQTAERLIDTALIREHRA